MNRAQLEHILRACGAIVLDHEFVVIGSQAILGAHPGASPVLLRSMDADLYPKNRPEEAPALDGAIGEGSLFHQTFGYYVHAVGPETAILPQGWEGRLVRICNENTRGVTGLCLDPVDLAVSKLAAGRDADLEFVRELARYGLMEVGLAVARLDTMPLPAESAERIATFLRMIRTS